MTTQSAQYLSKLHKQIDKYFSFNEVKTLCFDLGVDYENIPGDMRSAFIRNLIVSMAKWNRLQELVDKVREERPFANWQNVPSGFELPAPIADEDIRQVAEHNVYNITYNQQGQVVHGPQVNVGKDAHIGQIGDNITTGGGDYVDGDKDVHHGDVVNGNKVAGERRPSPSQSSTSPTNAKIQKVINKLEHYLKLAVDEHKQAADELAASVNLILAASKKQENPLMFKLLCLGQIQLARQLEPDVQGIDEVVEEFVTAVKAAANLSE
ncbi:MAG: hypothetical protein GY803_20190 [Chloroflexi bacterium]|nr:hypothetical protein [Chloroflexota bacterium]